jgi:ribonucleoside-diphosphate reductase alpha chain
VARICETVQRAAVDESERLAAEKGSFPNLHLSIYRDCPRRNAALLSCAPCGTIAMVTDCSSGIEPVFMLCYKKQNILGGLELHYDINPYLRAALLEVGMLREDILARIVETGSVQSIAELPRWIRETFVTAMDLQPSEHVLMQAVVQRYVDNSVSKTVNMPNHATVADVRAVYLEAWKLGCKGITVRSFPLKKCA